MLWALIAFVTLYALIYFDGWHWIVGPIQKCYWRIAYRRGKSYTRFIAPDIKREVEIVDTRRVADGIVTARTRTWNLLYQISFETYREPPFGPEREIPIEALWYWGGESWGGSVPKGTDDAR